MRGHCARASNQSEERKFFSEQQERDTEGKLTSHAINSRILASRQRVLGKGEFYLGIKSLPLEGFWRGKIWLD